ncbi:CIC11C00000001466 [Sungouiella intermedia]|uniref:CIC11C00000001466 n=1 Tax=Sungouiella intermedia TaxID=45354 RepID=A0A1L0BA96_9ASCO|nr:CIC11C00000001466 [[Candida] intermedia]
MALQLATPSKLSQLGHVLKKYMKFIGPGLMVSVAYMDPGNYSTAVAAGSAYQYKLLFSIFLLNCLAIFLQILSAKLGAVTGLDLAANCRENLPPKLNLFIYILAEIAIIATDLAEVVGTAIALNILFNLPLFVGVIVTVVDVLVVLAAYRPNGPLMFIRVFEGFVSVLVGATVVCFGIELFQVSKEPDFSAIEVLKGFLPNEKVVDMSERKGGNGLFLSLAILGATVMPHSLYLGSGLVQARLKDYDIKHGFHKPGKPAQVAEAPLHETNDTSETSIDFSSNDYAHAVGIVEEEECYKPSIHAINDTMTYTIVELVISLFTVALFVNATILIVAGATVGSKSKRDDDDDSDNDSDNEGSGSEGGDLFTIYNLLSTHLSPTAGFVFALALLCLGQSAGVVCTLAGQMVLEGFLLWSFPPVIRRLVTRGLAIAPCLFVVSVAGREGLASTLNALQVVLSLLLPTVTAPLIWFTCSKEIMKVPILVREGDEDCDTIYETDEVDQHDLATQSTIYSPKKSARYNVTEPAIRLQNLKKAHPCAGWEDSDDEIHEQQLLVPPNGARSRSHSITGTGMMSTSSRGASNDETFHGLDEEANLSGDDVYVVRGYTDMSNGPVMTVLAVLVWGFVTCLNIFLLGSMVLGYDVPL